MYTITLLIDLGFVVNISQELYLPKHLLWFVSLSMYTFELSTWPNGINIWVSSLSLNSCGKWYINKLLPSGPKVILCPKKVGKIPLKYTIKPTISTLASYHYHKFHKKSFNYVFLLISKLSTRTLTNNPFCRLKRKWPRDDLLIT